MKKVKILSVLCSVCVFSGIFNIVGCGSDNENQNIVPENLSKPSIPSGVILSDVDGYDNVQNALSEFNSAYVNFDEKDYNVSLDYYYSYERTYIQRDIDEDGIRYLGANAKSTESHITFSNSDFIYDSQSGTIKGSAVLNDIKTESYYDNLPSTEDTAETTAHTYTANNTGDGYNWVTDGGVLIYNSNDYVLPSINSLYYSLFSSFSSLNSDLPYSSGNITQLIYWSADYSYHSDYVQFPVRFDEYEYEALLFHGNVEVKDYVLEIKTNGAQYWLNTSFEITGSNSQGSISHKYEGIIYMDTAAGLTEQDIQVPSIEDCAQDALYLYVDNEQAKADLEAGKGLTVQILGGGSPDKITSLTASFGGSLLDLIDGKTIYISNEMIQEYKNKYSWLHIYMAYSGSVTVNSVIYIQL